MRVMLPSLLSRSLSSPLGQSAGAAAFDPLSLSPVAWWDFTDVSTLKQTAGGSAVASDGDPIGWAQNKANPGTYDISQGTFLRRPTYKVNVKNGLSAGRWDGVDDIIGTSLTLTQPFTIIDAIYPTVGSSAAESLGSSSPNYTVMRVAGSNTNLIFAGSVVSGSFSPNINAWYIYSAIFNGSSSSIYRNATTVATGNAGSAAMSTNFNLGQIAGSFTGDRLMTFMFSSSLSAGNLSSIWTYINGLAAIY